MLHLPERFNGYCFAGAGVALLIVIKLTKTSELDAIPTVGPKGWFGSWWAGLRFLTNGLEILQEGYEKHKSAPFKVAQLYHWIVVVSSREHIGELQRALNDVFSFREALNDDIIHTEYTLGYEVHHNPYHLRIIHSQLTRNIEALCSEIRDEIVMAFDDALGIAEDEWKSVPALSLTQQVVCRTSNRVFVGLPLCRDPDWIDLNIRHTVDVALAASVIGLFPKLLKPIVGPLCCTYVFWNNLCARKLLRPIIMERQRYMKVNGKDWADKPNDALSWLMNEAVGAESTLKHLTNRILTVNFTAIHTSSQSFGHVLYYLAANPQYIQPLRKEVESIVEEDGWSKAALDKMRKVDSFIKECQRLEGVGGLLLTRKALKDFTFCDGTFIPQGTTISAAARCIHYDEAFYENPHAFDPFRFSSMREREGEGTKHQLVVTTNECLIFGHGRHACPGRFFAANKLKSMLAHIVITYDIKLSDNTARPKTRYVGAVPLVDPSAKVMFRKRVDCSG